MKETIISAVTNGRLEEWKGKAVKAALAKHEGRVVEIIIQTFYPKISDKQNRFMHGVFLPQLWAGRRAGGEMITQEDSRQEFKERFGPHEAKRDNSGKWTFEPKSVGEWTTKETEDAMEECRAEYAEFFELPFPNEQ